MPAGRLPRSARAGAYAARRRVETARERSVRESQRGRSVTGTSKRPPCTNETESLRGPGTLGASPRPPVPPLKSNRHALRGGRGLWRRIPGELVDKTDRNREEAVGPQDSRTHHRIQTAVVARLPRERHPADQRSGRALPLEPLQREVLRLARLEGNPFVMARAAGCGNDDRRAECDGTRP